MAHARIATALTMLLVLSGCTAFFQPGFGTGTRTGESSSLVDYLYPNGEVPPEQSETVPHVNLPLRVGLAFVPSSYRGTDISEATKMMLLENVKAEFIEHDYVQHIEIIPDTYLRSSDGITGMQQVARLYGVDVMALVSYDQVNVTEDNNAAFFYWTIIGAYMIKGTDNEVQTFVDTAVFDVATAKLLFRAPGADTSTGRSTAIESMESSRQRSAASFTTAMDKMTGNLSSELVNFEERAAENPELIEVSYKPSYGGGGSVDGVLLLLLVLVAILGISIPIDSTPTTTGRDRRLSGR